MAQKEDQEERIATLEKRYGMIRRCCCFEKIKFFN